MSKQRMRLSDQIRQAIGESDKTRYRIATDTGINEAALGKFFHGERGLSLETIDTLCEYLELEIVKRSKQKRN